MAPSGASAGGLVQHPLGDVRVHPHALPLAGAERARLVPDRVGHAEPSEVVHEPRAPQRSHVGEPEAPSRLPRPRRCSATAAECPSVNGDLRSTKFAIASSAASNCSSESTTASAGSAAMTASHAWSESRPSRISAACSHTSADSLGSNCLPLRCARKRDGRLAAADAMRDLDVLRELRDARRDRDRVARELPRPAASVPLLVGRARRHRARRAAARAAARASAPASRAMRSCRRARDAPTSRARARPGIGAAAGLPAPTRRSIAAAPASPGACVYLPDFSAMSSPNHFACSCASEWQPTLIEERRVVDGHARLLALPDPLGHPQRDEALTEHVLHRLPEPEVDPERQRRHELGEAELMGRVVPPMGYRYPSGARLPILLARPRQRRRTSSSAAVGWMAMVRSRSALVAPMRRRRRSPGSSRRRRGR